MTTLLITSFIILFTYTVYYLLRVGLLPSHSDSYFALGKQGWMFQVSLFLSAFLLMIPLLEVTPDPFKFTAFFTCAPVLFTAFAPDFRKENGKVTMERKVHMMGAKIGGCNFIYLGCVDGLLVWLASNGCNGRVGGSLLFA